MEDVRDVFAVAISIFPQLEIVTEPQENALAVFTIQLDQIVNGVGLVSMETHSLPVPPVPRNAKVFFLYLSLFHFVLCYVIS